MDQITSFLEGIDFNAIITWITDLFAQVNFQEILDSIAEMVKGFIA